MVNRVSTYIYIFESGLEKHKPPVGRHLNGIRMTLRLSKRLCLGTSLPVAVFEYSENPSNLPKSIVLSSNKIV